MSVLLGAGPARITPIDTRVVVRPPVTRPDHHLVVVGDRGAPGRNGDDGEDAYEIAVRNGYTGTEADWLLSLTPSDIPDLTVFFENGLIP